jgi:hypothetical protein
MLGLRRGASRHAIRKAFREWLHANNPLMEANPHERWAKSQALRSIEASVDALLGPRRHAAR